MPEDSTISRDTGSLSHRDPISSRDGASLAANHPAAGLDISGDASRSTLSSLIATQATRTPDANAIIGPGRESLSYAGLRTFLKQTGARLAELGVGHADRVAVALPAGPNWPSVCLRLPR